MTPTKYQKYVFGLKSGHLKIEANGAGAYTIPRSVSYPQNVDKKNVFFNPSLTTVPEKFHYFSILKNVFKT